MSATEGRGTGRVGKRYGDRASRNYRRFERWTRDSAHAALVATNASFAAKARSGLEGWSIPDELRDQLTSYLGSDEGFTELASDGFLRAVVAQHLVAQIIERHHAFPNEHFYFFTFIDDRVRTKDLRCTLQFKAFMKRVHGSLDYAGLHSFFGVKEIQPYVNWQAGLGRDLAPHLHMIVMTDGPITSEQRRRVTTSRRFESNTDAPEVTISERLPVDGELAHMVAYMLKQPERGANLVPPRLRIEIGLGGPKSVRQGHRQLDAAIRPDLAIRLVEALSQLRLSQMLVSGGDGKAMVASTRAMMLKIRTQPVSLSVVAAAWQRARVIAGKDQYAQIIIEPT